MKTARAAILVALVVLLGYWVLESESSPNQSSGQAGATSTTVSRITSNTQPTAPSQTTTSLAPAHPAQQVITLVANATKTGGAALRFSTALKVRGYDTLAPVNATTTVATSHVYYVAGYQPDAEIIAEALTLTPSAVSPMPSSPPVSSIRTAQVLVLIGSDLAGQSTSSSTTTSSSGSATSTKSG